MASSRIHEGAPGTPVRLRPLRRVAIIFIISLAIASTSSIEVQTNSDPGHTPADSISAVNWGPCPDDYFVEDPWESFHRGAVDCATIDVPALYGKAGGMPDFRLAMMRLLATGDSMSLGTLFVNPGGPGGSGIEAVQRQPFPEAIRGSYDIVGFDPRGVLHSQPVSGGPIRCSDELDFSSYWTLEATPENQAQADAIGRYQREYLSDCERRNPAWWTLGTRNVVRDLEVMRRRVTGDADLNFLGSSYGTTIAAGYMQAFPERIGHIMLDSPTDLSQDSDASVVVQARSTNEHLLRLVDGYAEIKGLTRAVVGRKLARILKWGDDDRLRGYAGLEPFPDGSNARLSTDTLFVRGMVALTYYDTEQVQESFNRGIDGLLEYKWNGFFEYMALALDGYDTESMLRAYQDQEPYDPHGYTRDNSFEIREMVTGIDQDLRDTRSHAEVRLLDRKVKAAAPFLWRLVHDPSTFEYFSDHRGNRWSWVAFDDPAIPDPPSHLAPRTNPSGTPVMVIGSRHESVTPYRYAVRTAETLESALITWDGDEHAPLAGFQHACLNRLFVAYMIHDWLPDRSITCTD